MDKHKEKYYACTYIEIEYFIQQKLSYNSNRIYFQSEELLKKLKQIVA